MDKQLGLDRFQLANRNSDKIHFSIVLVLHCCNCDAQDAHRDACFVHDDKSPGPFLPARPDRGRDHVKGCGGLSGKADTVDKPDLR